MAAAWAFRPALLVSAVCSGAAMARLGLRLGERGPEGGHHLGRSCWRRHFVVKYPSSGRFAVAPVQASTTGTAPSWLSAA